MPAKNTKPFVLRCSPEFGEQLAAALHAYAHAAYPPGGSECAQVAHETLLESARTVQRDAASESGAVLRRRQRTHFKAAVNWYFGEEGPGGEAYRAPLLRLIP